MPTQPRFFVPEVVQTSEMDCGPASLKALLEGFGISASYGRLREACQTEVDGTSIDVIEQVAIQLGLNAEQIMIPADHLLLADARALPALVVVRLPNGMTHFIIIWSKHGRFVQVMDPGTGRRWVDEKRLLADLYIHRFPVPAEAFREWAGTEGFLAPLRRRLAELQMTDARIEELISQASADPGWRGLAALDAAARMVASIVRANGLERGEVAGQVLARFFEEARSGADPWKIRPCPRRSGSSSRWRLILLIPKPQRSCSCAARSSSACSAAAEGAPETPEAFAEKGLPPELVAALREPPLHPEKEIWRALRRDGLFTFGVLISALLIATLGVTIEALLLQGVMRLGTALPDPASRRFAIAALALFVLLLFALELPLTTIQQRIGRRLEMRLRILLLEKIPRLSDRYFHSRLTSDMTMRAHGLRSLRGLPSLAMNALRLGFQLLLTAVGVIILDPASAPWAIAFALVFIAVSYFSNVFQREREMRLNTHNGALSRFYLDALLGLVPARMHGAERAMRREHETLLTEWARSSLDTWRISVILQGIERDAVRRVLGRHPPELRGARRADGQRAAAVLLDAQPARAGAIHVLAAPAVSAHAQPHAAPAGTAGRAGRSQSRCRVVG